MRRALTITALLGLIAYGASGLAVIQQDEVGIVRRLGAVLRDPWEPGLHWGLPWGFDRIDRVKTGQTRTLAIGGRDPGAAPLAQAPNPAADDFLTGDLNLVSAQAVIQYRVSDPVKYLFTATAVDEALTIAAESSLARALAGRPIADVLTTGRAEVADAVVRAVQERADRQGLGVSIRAVRLGRIAPPVAVAPAFADAARARSDLRQAVTKAEEYAERAEADAVGQAREIADRAAGQFDRSVQVAKGEADRFTKVLAESRKAPVASRRRLYLETVSVLLPRFTRKVVVAPGETLDLSLINEDRKTDLGEENVGPATPPSSDGPRPSSLGSTLNPR